MNELNVMSVCGAIAICVAAACITTCETKTAGIDTQRKTSAQIEACAKHGGTYILGGNDRPECIAPCGVAR